MKQIAPRFTYSFLQRLVGINPSVPWTVHWSSLVNGWNRVQRKSDRVLPGYGACQYIQAVNGISFGENVRIGHGVKIVSASHNLNDFDQHDPRPPIRIGDNCWIGADAVILPGVEIGNHVVILEGSVVTKNIPDNSLVGGIPARVLRELGPYQGQPLQDQPLQDWPAGGDA